jgi:hypothetical protein
MADDNPKIFVDDDWKRQAHEEKRRLAEQEKAKQEAKRAEKAPAGPEGAGGEPRGLPPASFEALVSTFATQTLLALGLMEHPSIGRSVNLELAKLNIDMLAVIEEKTKGNLSSQEKVILDQTLHQLRMAFVEVASAQTGPIGAPTGPQ